MPSMKTLEVVARPSKKEGSSSFWSTSFMLFGSDEESGAKRTTISAETLPKFIAATNEWAKSLPTPDVVGDEIGYSVTVMKGTGRWPNGFKAAFERRSFIVKHAGVVRVSV